MEEKRHQYGGQAIMEGVMIRGRHNASIAVRSPAGEICVRSMPVPGWATGILRSIPYLRGMVIFAETLIVGMKALTLSAVLSTDETNVVAEDGEPTEEGAIGSFTIAAMLVVALGLGIAIFFLLPFFVSKLFESAGLGSFGANVVDGILRLAAFIGYVWLVAKMQDIQRVLAYHGAEHMTVHAQEAKDAMTVEAVRKYPAAHPRCGTAFLLTVMLIAFIVFLFIPRDPIWLVVTSRILLVPLIAGASYEFIRYSGRHQNNIYIRVFISPSLLLQELTTRQPNDDQIEVAIAALDHAVALDSLGHIDDYDIPSSDAWRRDHPRGQAASTAATDGPTGE